MQTPQSTREIAGDTGRDQAVTPTETDREPNPPDARFAREPDTERADDQSVRDSATTTQEPGRASTDQVASDAPELLPQEANTEFRSRWETIQTGFVDEPRQTVEQADELVANVMQRLAEGFAAERERLEQQWGRGEDVSTEDLRIALQRYRSFFERLLAA